MEEIKALAQELLAAAPTTHTAELRSVTHLSGDASGRAYYRLNLAAAPLSSVVLMVLAHGSGPPAYSPHQLNQDDTFVELSNYFRERGLPVPELLLDARSQGALLIEDFGDLALWRFAFNQLDATGEVHSSELGPFPVQLLFQQAVDVMLKIHACSPELNRPVFQRSLRFEEFRLEAERFITFFMRPHDYPRSQIEAVRTALDALCESIMSHPMVLMHRDFMAWNLQVLPTGKIGVLDYQDAIVGPAAYDLISLLHDRDVDFALGKSFCADILAYCIRNNGLLPGDFIQQYREVLLQRHLRLAGQFDMLTNKTGNPIYRDWVPGCFRRLGHFMAQVEGLHDVFEILYASVPEFRMAADSPWSLELPINNDYEN